MKKFVRHATRIAALILLTLGAAALAAGTFDLSWWTVDGGGGMNSSGGVYTLSGTIGQPDAGTLKGGSYELTGGFWSPTYYKNAALYWTCYE